MHLAEAILKQVMEDWREKVNTGKTERIFLSGEGRQTFGPRREGG